MVTLLTSLATLTSAITGLSLVSAWPVPASDWLTRTARPSLSQLAMCGAHDDIITLVTDNYQLLWLDYHNLPQQVKQMLTKISNEDLNIKAFVSLTADSLDTRGPGHNFSDPQNLLTHHFYLTRGQGLGGSVHKLTVYSNVNARDDSPGNLYFRWK